MGDSPPVIRVRCEGPSSGGVLTRAKEAPLSGNVFFPRVPDCDKHHSNPDLILKGFLPLSPPPSGFREVSSSLLAQRVGRLHIEKRLSTPNYSTHGLSFLWTGCPYFSLQGSRRNSYEEGGVFENSLFYRRTLRNRPRRFSETSRLDHAGNDTSFLVLKNANFSYC